MSNEQTPIALAHLMKSMSIILIALVLTYLIPGLAEFKPWIPGEPIPVWNAFFGENEELENMPSFAEASYGKTVGDENSVDDEDEEENVDKEEPEAETENAAFSPQKTKEKNFSSPNSPQDTAHALEINPKLYAGIPQAIEDPSRKALDYFFKKLKQTAQKKEGAITRIAHYGDSSIATDFITYTVRRKLQKRFGDAGHGFVLIAKGHMPYRHRDVSHRASKNWFLRELVREEDKSGHYGYGGVQYRGRPGSWAIFETDKDGEVGKKVSSFDIFYQMHKRGGDLQITVDDTEPREIPTRSETTKDAFEKIELPDGHHKLKLKFGGNGQPRLYGVALERNVPGVVYDSLGLVGARGKRLLNFNKAHIKNQIARRDPDLLVLGFGGNEASDDIGKERYAEEYGQVIDRMRAGKPEMSCLILAPLDQAKKNERGHIRTIPTIPTIVEAQREVAFKKGCAFYNTFEAMGGEGAMLKWYRKRPKLALGDFRHATPAGYKVIGNMFYKALLKSFAESSK